MHTKRKNPHKMRAFFLFGGDGGNKFEPFISVYTESQRVKKRINKPFYAI